jgi:hypothetical protein
MRTLTEKSSVEVIAAARASVAIAKCDLVKAPRSQKTRSWQEFRLGRIRKLQGKTVGGRVGMLSSQRSIQRLLNSWTPATPELQILLSTSKNRLQPQSKTSKERAILQEINSCPDICCRSCF